MESPGKSLAIAKRYWNEVPVKVFDLAAELGLGPVSDRTLSDTISGMIRRKRDGGFEIVVNSKHAQTRQRFTLAHEIGHFIFHRDRLHAGTSDTLAYRIDGLVYPNAEIGPEQERQANNFASNLLIPDNYLRAAQAVGIVDPDELAEKFEVSPAAMRIKLGLSREPWLFDRRHEPEMEERTDRFGFDRF